MIVTSGALLKIESSPLLASTVILLLVTETVSLPTVSSIFVVSKLMVSSLILILSAFNKISLRRIEPSPTLTITSPLSSSVE